ncbi:MAG: tRNA (adenosine(37)-N6)-dimethylallyltransferase MiaA [Tissierellales bacterium]|nr:tRNA (adenosine(37)-N6)-dimethylallyltransferase MiaA [Tissierellales bacterium]
MENKLILIVGPTAVGKTYISVKIAKLLSSEVISADSMQIYRYMDIGTAKIRSEEKENVPHHLIDVVYPDEAFTVSDFKNSAEKLIKELHGKNQIPIIAGGTGLYVNSLIYDLNFSNTLSDPDIRSDLTAYCDTFGKEALHQRLETIDPVSAKKIHMNNVKRIIRAIEVYLITGKPFSEYNPNFRICTNNYELIMIGLEMQRDLLYNKINERVDSMINNGLIEEVRSLLKKGYGRDLISMQGIGYKEILMYLYEEISLDEALHLLKRNTRRFAKRQFTWFKADERIKWFEVGLSDHEKTLENIKNYLHERGLLNETNY